MWRVGVFYSLSDVGGDIGSGRCLGWTCLGVFSFMMYLLALLDNKIKLKYYIPYNHHGIYLYTCFIYGLGTEVW